MHAVFLTFEFSGEDGDRSRTFRRFTDTAPNHPGVVSCTWLNDGSTIGAFYVFKSAEAAEQYLNSGHLRALASHPGVYDFYIRHFSTLASISAALPSSSSMLRPADGVSGDACAVWQSDIQPQVEQHPA